MEQVKLPKSSTLVSIQTLKPYETNARTHSETQIEQIANSILEFGFINPILIDEEKRVIAGHGRLMAANRLGLKEVPVTVVPHLTEKQKQAYCIADNAIALNSKWDDDLLKSELSDLKDDNSDLTTLGFSDDELDDFFKEPEPKVHKPERKVLSNVEAPIAQPKAANPDLPDHKLPKLPDPADKQKPLPMTKGKPICQAGDVWLLGKHFLKCANVRDELLDQLIIEWQERAGKEAKLKKTGKSFTDTGIARNNKRK